MEITLGCTDPTISKKPWSMVSWCRFRHADFPRGCWSHQRWLARVARYVVNVLSAHTVHTVSDGCLHGVTTTIVHDHEVPDIQNSEDYRGLYIHIYLEMTRLFSSMPLFFGRAAESLWIDGAENVRYLGTKMLWRGSFLLFSLLISGSILLFSRTWYVWDWAIEDDGSGFFLTVFGADGLWNFDRWSKKQRSKLCFFFLQKKTFFEMLKMPNMGLIIAAPPTQRDRYLQLFQKQTCLQY